MIQSIKSKETKLISFRTPIATFEALQKMGVEMGLSAHEVASKIVQENYQEPIAIEAEVVKDNVTTTTGSKKLIQTEVSKQVFYLNSKEINRISLALCGKGCLHNYVFGMNIGAEYSGLTRIGEDLWEVLIETNVIYK